LVDGGEPVDTFDRRVLAIGMAVQSVLGSPPAPPI
jgi:hypothetical protein